MTKKERTMTMTSESTENETKAEGKATKKNGSKKLKSDETHAPQVLGDVMHPPPPPIIVAPVIGLSFNPSNPTPRFASMTYEIDGYYVPEVTLTMAPPNSNQLIQQPIALQGVVLGSIFDELHAVVRLTAPGAGRDLDGAPKRFAPGSIVLVPHKGTLGRFQPRVGIDSTGNRVVRMYEIAFNPPAQLLAAELSPAEIAALRMQPGGGLFMIPGTLGNPANEDQVADALKKIDPKEVVI